MAFISGANTNYLNLTANTWTSLVSGTANYVPAPKTGKLFISTTGGTLIAVSLDGGTTYNFMLPSNVVVDMGQVNPSQFHVRCSAANNIVTWWWVTE